MTDEQQAKLSDAAIAVLVIAKLKPSRDGRWTSCVKCGRITRNVWYCDNGTRSCRPVDLDKIPAPPRFELSYEVLSSLRAHGMLDE